MPVTPETRSIQGSDELHVGLEVPRHAARQIFRWAQDQQWPEGTELEEPGDYHVTILYTPSGREEHKEGWWLDHMDETEVSVRGVTSFGAQEKGFAHVLLLDAPEIREHATMLQERAKALGLEVTDFPGGYKPHLTIAYGPTRLTKKPKPPEWVFHVGPSSVSDPRISEEEGSDESGTTASAYSRDTSTAWARTMDPASPQPDTSDASRDSIRLWAPSTPGRMAEHLGGPYAEYGTSPDLSRAPYDPQHVETLDDLSLRSVAAQLHYQHEQTGSLNAQQSTDYARRILQLVGYPTDQITLQAALQAWQSEYPEDKVVMETPEVSRVPEKFAVTSRGLSQSISDTGLLAGPAHRTSQHGWVSPELQQIIDAFGNQYGLSLMADESPNQVSFDHIEIPQEARGTGAGSRMMQQLKSYADRTGKPLKVEHVVNYPFFDRFEWMRPTGSDEYSYVPQSAPQRSTVPTQVNSPEDHWPEFGEQPPDQHRDVGFSNDWAWHQGHYRRISSDGGNSDTTNGSL